MYVGRTLFSQVMDFISWTSFDRIVAKYRGDVGVRTLRCTEHFRVMAFAQIMYRESLRDIEPCLGSQPSKLCGMGLCEPIAKSTLADANERRNWRIWSDLAAVLIKRARKLYLQDDIGLDLANTVYALDSTTIDLCLLLFPWADFRSTKAGIKMHTLLDLRGPILSFIHVSDGKMGDAPALDLIVPETRLAFVRFEPYVVPKKSLTGDTTECVNTRVLQVIYEYAPDDFPAFIGQQVDVFIETRDHADMTQPSTVGAIR
jgi:hypothetical protein